MGRRYPVAKVAPAVQGKIGWIHDVGCTQDFVAVADFPMYLGNSNDDNYGLFRWSDDRETGKVTLVDLSDGSQESYSVRRLLQAQSVSCELALPSYSDNTFGVTGQRAVPTFAFPATIGLTCL